MLVAACLAVLLIGLAIESAALSRARRAVPVRIHVNGTRGKSTVTRMIWAALLHAGIPTLGKTTGTEARFLLPDGSEVPLRRRGRTSIREQIRTVLLARRRGVHALVVECMAIQPQLQWVSEHRVFRSSIGVVTNVRLDHTEMMGRTVDQVAGSLSNTVPRDGVLVLGDALLEALFARRAAALGSRIVTVADAHSGWLGANQAVALAVTRELGIDDRVAREGMSRAALDPGAASRGRTQIEGRNWDWLDARSANDPESLWQLLCEHGDAFHPESTLTIYNHRADRGRRLLDFARARFGREKAGLVWVTGDRPPWFLWRTIRRIHGVGLRYVAPSGLRSGLAGCPGTVSSFVLSGNTRGLNLRQVLGQVNHG